MDFSDSRLKDLGAFCTQLSTPVRKALITLARSQSVPDPSDSPVLFSKVQPILDKISVHPPFESLHKNTLSSTGELIVHCVQSPLLSGLLIVFALGMPFTDTQIQQGCLASFNKELCATQTRRLGNEWDWDALLGASSLSGSQIHTMFPVLSRLQKLFQIPLSNFKSRLEGRTILPHYSRKGVSSETASYLLHRIDKRARYGIHGNRRTYHRSLDPSNVTSLDIIHHYVRTGLWARGRTEMKQRWYPNGIQPRTYFAWGGEAIAASTYLRQFFNDLADSFPPTHRHNRVQPDWLHDPRVPPGGFLFYDLTSFTSWFHEQVPFLRALERYFTGTGVYLVGENLSLRYYDVGSLIDGYIRWCNDFPPFIISKKLTPYGPEDEYQSLRHLCAGFLGIPGNLVTCTLAHGLAMASQFSHIRQLQVPGDDVGASYRSSSHAEDIMTCASTLGTLQMEKVFRLPEISVYLKRLVVDKGSSITLADMLIYPLLPYLTDNTADLKGLSLQYRPPPADQIVKRACSVLTSFMRDLWKLTSGDLNQFEADLILSFLRGIHDRLRIPYGAVWQSRFFCDEGPTRSESMKGVVIKFPVDDDQYIRKNPDRRFADKFVEVMHIRATSGVRITEFTEGLSEGDIVCVPKRRGWSFLEDMGYVRVEGIPGDVMTLVGPDAKIAFLNACEPNLREIEVLCDIGIDQLRAVGLLSDMYEPSFFSTPQEVLGVVERDLRSEQSWRYSHAYDWDKPDSSGYSYIVESEYGSGRLYRSSSPPLDESILDY